LLAANADDRAADYDGSMPKLACWSCGRQIYTVAPIQSLFTEERRCPRCGAFLNDERRAIDRRGYVRRQNRTDEPGPPAKGERREVERRVERRRKPAGS
jgi:ribosomal protein S27AE